jgi:excisionase family DNA binding protein
MQRRRRAPRCAAMMGDRMDETRVDASAGDGGAVMSLPEFCKRARISVRHFYALATRGEAPATVRLGRRRLVRKETGDAWLLAREAA